MIDNQFEKDLIEYNIKLAKEGKQSLVFFIRREKYDKFLDFLMIDYGLKFRTIINRAEDVGSKITIYSIDRNSGVNNSLRGFRCTTLLYDAGIDSLVKERIAIIAKEWYAIYL